MYKEYEKKINGKCAYKIIKAYKYFLFLYYFYAILNIYYLVANLFLLLFYLFIHCYGNKYFFSPSPEIFNILHIKLQSYRDGTEKHLQRIIVQ